MSLYHTNCNHTLRLDLSSLVEISGVFNFTFKGLKVVFATFNENVKKKRPKFICDFCEKEVPETQISAICENCGRIEDVNSLVKYEGYPGIYCKSCAEDLNLDGQFKLVSKIISVANI